MIILPEPQLPELTEAQFSSLTHADWCGLGAQVKGGHPLNACTCGAEEKARRALLDTPYIREYVRNG